MRQIPACTLALALALILEAAAAGEGGRDFKPRQVVSPVRPITDASISKHSEMENPLADSDLVIGLSVDGAARAYPINMLTGPSREIINDKLGGRSIAATW